MSDEEKSIEEIIAELENIEKKKVDEVDSVEHDEAVLMDASAIEDEHVNSLEEPIEPPEKLTLEQPRDELSLEEPLEDRIPEAPSEEVFNAPIREELVLEEPIESISGKESHEKLVLEEEFVEEGPQAVSSEESFTETHSEELVLDEVIEEEPQEMTSETIFEGSPREESVLEDPFEEKPLEKPPEEVFGEETHEELIFEKPVEEEPSELVPDEIDGLDLQKEQKPEPLSEEAFAAMDEAPPEGPPPDEYGDEPPGEPPLPPGEDKPRRVSRMTVLLGLVLIALILVAYFVWPTMYEFKTTTVKGNTYEVRINRLTSDREYNVMGTWQSMPPSEKSIYRARIKAPSKVPKTAAKTDFEKAREMAQARAKAKAEVKVKANAEEKSKATLEEPKTVTVKAVEKQPEKVEVTIARKESAKAVTESVQKEPVKAVTESAQKEPIKATKEVTVAASIPPTKPSPTQEPAKTVPTAEKKAEEPKVMVLVKKETPEPEKKGSYAIQIASMRFEEFADELVEALGKKGFEGHIDTVKSKRGGVWHTVMVGHFTNKRQARAFMKEKKMTKNYPGCFIRKLYNR